jgi:PTH1 family peptidyl-tRNA hydrolase
MKLLLGLGNIGPQYARTRHNIGFMVVNRLSEQHASSPWQLETKFMAAINEFRLPATSERVILAQPQTMMNLSGEAARRLMDFYKITPADVWAVFDDVDVPFGRLRIRQGGRSSGHQGVKSLIQHLGPDFVRVKVGISLNDRTKEPSEVYVLKPFNPDEQTHLSKVISHTAEILTDHLTGSLPPETTFDLI